MQSQAGKFERRDLIDLTDRIDRASAVHCGGGRFGDIYKCTCRESSSSSSTVAVKALRCFVSSEEDDSDTVNKDLRRELGLWRRLDRKHQNIVPLLGMTKGFGPLDAIVSAWMPNGTLHSFLKNDGKGSSVVQRLSMLSGIASCLEYLHSIPVLHGDLTSSNILVDEEYNPRLTDFGLSSALGKLQTGMTYLNRHTTDPGAIRWAAPELFNDEYEPKPSADVYSFGCIMLEVLGGNIPWEGKPETVVIGLKIVQRKFPDRPNCSDLQDEHWALIVNCWSLPGQRPSAQQVVHRLADLKPVDSMEHRRPQMPVFYTYPTGGGKRALLIAIRHVASERGTSFDGLPNLHWAHRDARTLCDNLLESQGYRAEDVILMLDDPNHPRELWPTRKRILHQIDRLVQSAPEKCRFFFYFTGHAIESPDDGRDDGRDSEIIAADGKPILDYILHDRLVRPLAKMYGSQLFALFDCSHSEKLLDPQLSNGPNTYSRVWNTGPGALFKDLTLVIINLLRLRKKVSRRRNPPPVPRGDVTLSETMPQPAILRGEVGGLQYRVISLAACRTKQRTHDDDERQLTFTKLFLDTLSAKPGISWVELCDELKARIAEMRARSEEYLRSLNMEDLDNSSLHHWTQEPKYTTSSHVDLTEPVSL